MRHPLYMRAFYQVVRCLYSIGVLILLIIIGRFIYGGLTHLGVPTDISRVASTLTVCFIVFSPTRVQALIVNTEIAIKNAILK